MASSQSPSVVELWPIVVVLGVVLVSMVLRWVRLDGWLNEILSRPSSECEKDLEAAGYVKTNTKPSPELGLPTTFRCAQCRSSRHTIWHNLTSGSYVITCSDCGAPEPDDPPDSP